MGDTAIVPYDQQTSASRSTVLMGNAVLAPAATIQGKLAAMAARLHGVDEAGVTSTRASSGCPTARSSRRSTCSSAGLGRLGGELTGVGEARKDAEPDHPLGGAPAFFEFNCTVDRGVTSTRRRATSRSTAT